MQNGSINSILEAVQNPTQFITGINNFCLEYSDGQVVFYPSNIAITFPVSIDNKKYALKCYFAHKPYREEHFRLLKKYIKEKAKSYFLDFEFFPLSLTLFDNEQCYTSDILLCPWVEGTTHHHEIYKAAHLGNRDRIKQLRLDFLNLVGDFNNIGFVHGDLKPQNIIIEEKTKTYKIIDYDAAWIYETRNVENHEIGTIWYQHPDRTELDYNLNTDNYSIVMIAISLIAIEENFSLFEKYNNGDNLIFSPNMICNNSDEAYKYFSDEWQHNIFFKDMLHSLKRKTPYANSIDSCLNNLQNLYSNNSLQDSDILIDREGDRRRFYRDGLYGYADSNGKIFVDAQYSNAKEFVENWAVVQSFGKHIIIDQNGKIITNKYQDIISIKNNKAIVKNKSKYGVYDLKNQKVLIAAEWDSIKNENNNSYLFCRDTESIYFDFNLE